MIYLDHHATTPVDPAVVEAMLPWFTTHYGNPHSVSHSVGRFTAKACEQAFDELAFNLDASADSILITSGATESNNLAIDGVMRHPRQRRRHIVTATTEHPAVIDPIMRLQREGFEVTFLPVVPQGQESCGQIDLEALRHALNENTALVSIMWANNEIGTIQPIKQIAEIVHAAGALLHCDATQAVGRLPTHLAATGIDLLSASAHKFYGPKGVGLLALGKQQRIRIRPLFEGGGQQHGLRSGTLNVPGLIGMAAALRVCEASRVDDNARQEKLRNHLWQQLKIHFPQIELNGPSILSTPMTPSFRLPNNLNVAFMKVEGETLMAAAPELAVSSGSACSSVDPKPSHVLTALGLSESRARRSLRFGLGRFTTAREVASAVEMLVNAHHRVLAE